MAPTSQGLTLRPPRLREARATRQAARARRTVSALLKGWQVGHIELRHPDGEVSSHDDRSGTAAGAAWAAMRVHDEQVYARVLKSGDIGLAEAYIDGQWHTPDLPALLKLLMHNRQTLERAVYGSVLGSLAYRLVHALRRNTRAGSRRNIHAHYDLGNAFYTLWLDETMNYSSAWFGEEPGQTLAQAQARKMARALDEAAVGPRSRVLEVGCGWGAVAEAAAKRGAHLTGITLSTEQLSHAQVRLQAQGLAPLADLRLQDYRDLQPRTEAERFDAIVSIEMFEAVGRPYWAGYFEMLRRNLRADGKACVQTITIRDELFARYVKGTDFIQQYVFPGGLLPSPSLFRAEAERAGLQVTNELAFGMDYARTLAQWRQGFHARADEVRALGFDERFMRLWDFYLAYCEAAFETGQTDVIQFTLAHRDGHRAQA